MSRRSTDRVVVFSAPKGVDILTVVRVDGNGCTLSTGEELIIKWSKLRTLAEQVCQERAPVWIRTWMTPDGNELIELHRHGAIATGTVTATPSAASEVF